ncbi:hypothetical protein GCM10027456_23900 [Kineosporia babensis]
MGATRAGPLRRGHGTFLLAVADGIESCRIPGLVKARSLLCRPDFRREKTADELQEMSKPHEAGRSRVAITLGSAILPIVKLCVDCGEAIALGIAT